MEKLFTDMLKMAGGPDFRSYNSMAPVYDFHPIKYASPLIMPELFQKTRPSRNIGLKVGPANLYPPRLKQNIRFQVQMTAGRPGAATGGKPFKNLSRATT